MRMTQGHDRAWLHKSWVPVDQATKFCSLAPSILCIIFTALAMSYKNVYYFICTKKESAR